MSDSKKHEETLETGCGGVAPRTGDPPRVAPGIDEPPNDDFAEEQRDLSTNKVGTPIYQLPPEFGRDTWGWDHSPEENSLIVVYLLMHGAKLPPELHSQLASFVQEQGKALTETERQEIIDTINQLKGSDRQD